MTWWQWVLTGVGIYVLGLLVGVAFAVGHHALTCDVDAEGYPRVGHREKSMRCNEPWDSHHAYTLAVWIWPLWSVILPPVGAWRLAEIVGHRVVRKRVNARRVAEKLNGAE